MNKSTPITILCIDEVEAEKMAARMQGSRALAGEAGSLNFHADIAAHGAGEFQTLWVPMTLVGTFSAPAGGEILMTRKASRWLDEMGLLVISPTNPTGDCPPTKEN